MRRASYFLLFVLFVALMWGCPTKRLVPEPMPPQPQVFEFINSNPSQHISYDWKDVLHILKGMAPLVGPGPWFFLMLA